MWSGPLRHNPAVSNYSCLLRVQSLSEKLFISTGGCTDRGGCRIRLFKGTGGKGGSWLLLCLCRRSLDGGCGTRDVGARLGRVLAKAGGGSSCLLR